MDRIVNLALLLMAAVGALAIIYVVAPILVPFILVAGCLGGLTWIIVGIARKIESRRDSSSHGR